MEEPLSRTLIIYRFKIPNNLLLMSGFLVALSCKLSLGSNSPEIDSRTLTLSPASSNIYSSTNLFQLPTVGMPVNNTFTIDALPMPVTGCQDSWTADYISLSKLSTRPLLNLDITNAPNLSPLSKDGAITELHFCTWPTDGYRQRFQWTHDKYCFIVFISIFNKNNDINICPDHFVRDSLFAEYHTFKLSSQSSRVSMARCCRIVDSAEKITPPNLSTPYYLLSANGTCPHVEGSVTSKEVVRLQETQTVEWTTLELCYYRKVSEALWTLEKKIELAVYFIVLGTPATTLVVVCLCQIRTRSNKRKFAYRQSRMSSNYTQASIMYRQPGIPPIEHQPSSSSLNERKSFKATRF